MSHVCDPRNLKTNLDHGIDATMRHSSKSTTLLIIFLQLISSSAFVLLKPGISSSPCRNSYHAAFLSAKPRRRRKEAQPASDSSKDEGDDYSSDLPDFELKDEQGDSIKETPANRPKAGSMMPSTSSSPARSVLELIADRSLEKTFEFDNVPESETLPDLVELARQRPPSDGSKRGRQEARRAAAQARDGSEQPQIPAIPSIPIVTDFVTNDKGKIQFNKVLEAGAWMGILLLVGWEIYINSPFFERSAPMAPIVY